MSYKEIERLVKEYKEKLSILKQEWLIEFRQQVYFLDSEYKRLVVSEFGKIKWKEIKQKKLIRN